MAQGPVDESRESSPDTQKDGAGRQLKNDLPFFAPPNDAKIVGFKPIIKAMGGTRVEKLLPGDRIYVRFTGRYARVVGLKDGQDPDETAEDEAVSKKVPMTYKGLQTGPEEDELNMYIEIGDGVFAEGVISRGINVEIVEDQEEPDESDSFLGTVEGILFGLLLLLIIVIAGGSMYIFL